MNCYYQLNQPGYAYMGRNIKSVTYGRHGIIKIYTLEISMALSCEAISIMPDGATDIMFVKKKNGDCEIFDYGTPIVAQSLCAALFLENGDSLFGVQFVPNVVELITGISVQEITDRVLKLEHHRELRQLADELFQKEDFLEQVQLFLQYYLSLWKEPYEEITRRSCIASYMLEQTIRSQGTVKLNELSQYAGYSTRYMNQMFTREYGISPKSYARLIRFQYILSELEKSQKLIDISAQLEMLEGNLIREFKQMTGITPKIYRKQLLAAQRAS